MAVGHEQSGLGHVKHGQRHCRVNRAGHSRVARGHKLSVASC